MKRVVAAGRWRSRNTVAHARSLLGKFLVRRFPDANRTEARMIVETEAYDGPEDLACHASKGRTPRTSVMFAPGGVWYVYLCYGIHEMLNLVTGPRDYPAAVLIRGLDGITGPGRLTRALAIDRSLNGTAADPESGHGLWIEDRGISVPPALIAATPRIGVTYAGPEWSSKPYRFLLPKCFACQKDNPAHLSETRG